MNNFQSLANLAAGLAPPRADAKMFLLAFGVSVSLLVVVSIYWRTMQLRRMQRLRGSSGSGPAVRVGQTWEYSTFFRWPFSATELRIKPRPGYDIRDCEHDLSAIADAARMKLFRVTDSPIRWRVLGYRWTAHADRTLRPVTKDSCWKISLSRQFVQKVRGTTTVERGRFPIGVDAWGNQVFFDLYSTALTLIVGASNAGKSTLFRNIIAGVRAKRAAQIFIVDPQRLMITAGAPETTVVKGGPAEWLAHFQWLEREHRSRLETLREHNVDNWLSLPVGKMSAVVTFVEESHSVWHPELASTSKTATPDERAFAEIQRLSNLLASQGRKVGLYMVAAMQDAQQGATAVRFVNAGTRCAFALGSTGASAAFLDGSTRASDQSLRGGRFVLLDGAGERVVRTYPG